ncbi:SRPBCC family protein [Kaistella palustris]|uniref:SRPBCC family protein n=1 Tax=Kaistella palustris TaxID=493376 RepID=UPI0003FDF7BC|nr:SRPBCC domain-containing protein [Kaistella palustris]
MRTLNYEKVIQAPIEKVWDLLWNPETYREWTKFFGMGTVMKTDWKVNGETLFLDENGNGMASTITSLHEPTEVVFSHLGRVKNGFADIKGEAVEEWSGLEEKYFLRAINENTTELRAVTHTLPEYEDTMNTGFNRGFEWIKDTAEKAL